MPKNHTYLKEGSIAPDFILKDQNEQEQKLSNYQGNYVLVYFYPKDDTPGCTQEACTIRDIYKDFKKNKIIVFGISADSSTRHKKFAEKYELPFLLLSDFDRKVMNKYKALKEKSMFGKTFLGIIRCSYVIDPQGIIAKVYPKVDPANHAHEILEDIRLIRKEKK